MGRYESLESLLGSSAASKIRTSKVLLVGAGGIGCEIVKELALAGFGEIHLVDLDTIDLSNLNRQFLFGQQHIKQPKARVAAEVASEFNPGVHIVPYEANIITDSRFTPKWFKSFRVAFNALDNAEARRHVNRMCVSTGVPLIDCGTAGFHGQVQVILPQEKTECYDCRSHPTSKSFAICTIRSTPSQPIHCVVWAKSFLFALLFGPEEHTDSSVDDGSAESDEETKQEIKQLSNEKNELIELKRSTKDSDFVEKVVRKVFVSDIERLATIAVVNKPVPLKGYNIPEERPVVSDQSVWSVDEALGVLNSSARALAARDEPIEFDKDDDEALDFVAAATVLRSQIFGIPAKSKFEIKQMAGNIIPAIATTNAIVSGMGVIEAMKLCSESNELKSSLRCTNIFRSKDQALLSEVLQPSSSECPVSSVVRTRVSAPASTPLRTIVEDLLQKQLGYGDLSLVTDSLLYDPDFEDNLSRSLADLKLDERFVTVIDDDDRKQNIELYITTQADAPMIDHINIPLRPDIKRQRANDEDEEETAAKHAKTEDSLAVTEITLEGDQEQTDGYIVL